MDMATILAFRRDPGRVPKPLPSGHSAQVFFFTGVRYERDAAAALPPKASVARKRSSKTRMAQPSA
jgi:hypothetical protein